MSKKYKRSYITFNKKKQLRKKTSRSNRKRSMKYKTNKNRKQSRKNINNRRFQFGGSENKKAISELKKTLSNNSIQTRLIKSTAIEIGSFENIKKNSYHYLHYKTAIKIFNDNLLFGGGYKSFPVLCKNYDHGQYNSIDRKAISVCSTHPHNMIIQILSSGGIIGFILFCPFNTIPKFFWRILNSSVFSG